MTVLVVDDTDSARDVAERILRFHGFEARGAASGSDALALLEQITPDLVLLDVAMPQMDGLAFLEHLREDPRWQSLPVVMMTAIADASSVHQAFRLGACDYLVKAQFTVPHLLQIVRRYARRAGEVAGG
jgi:CheY-like chemotaxis protein